MEAAEFTVRCLGSSLFLINIINAEETFSATSSFRSKKCDRVAGNDKMGVAIYAFRLTFCQSFTLGKVTNSRTPTKQNRNSEKALGVSVEVLFFSFC